MNESMCYECCRFGQYFIWTDENGVDHFTGALCQKHSADLGPEYRVAKEEDWARRKRQGVDKIS